MTTLRATLLLPLILHFGCASLDSGNDQQQRQTLLSGEALFGAPLSAAPAEDIFYLSPEMRTWLEQHVDAHPYARSRLRNLLQAMLDDGLLNLQYDMDRSLSAQATFRAREGNCLSFSVLFVALARELDLDVQFQMVDVPPSFSSQQELVILNNHINVRVKGIRRDVRSVQDHIVDFNSLEFNGNYDSQRVSDLYAVSLYHSNRAVEYLSQQDYEQAFRHLKRGLIDAPQIAGLWVNLGVLYARMGKPELAEMAYRQALRADPLHKSALVNLATTMRALGRLEEADELQERIQRHIRRNPYYYSQHARIALSRGETHTALTLLEQAIDLKDDEHQFYHLQGIAFARQGRGGEALDSLKQAREVAHRDDLRNIYQRKLSALE